MNIAVVVAKCEACQYSDVEGYYRSEAAEEERSCVRGDLHVVTVLRYHSYAAVRGLRDRSLGRVGNKRYHHPYTHWTNSRVIGCSESSWLDLWSHP